MPLVVFVMKVAFEIPILRFNTFSIPRRDSKPLLIEEIAHFVRNDIESPTVDFIDVCMQVRLDKLLECEF